MEVLLRAHAHISTLCRPIYCINEAMLKQAAQKLNLNVPNDIALYSCGERFEIQEGVVSAQAGRASFESFKSAIKLAKEGAVEAIVTLPIHKEAWAKAGIDYKGHTDYLRNAFKQEAIMMLGCEAMFVALYSEHIALKEVPKQIQEPKLKAFFLALYGELSQFEKIEKIAVLGLNPHAGDNGVLGDEERIIERAIKEANQQLGKEIFQGALVPDVAFTPRVRKAFKYFVAMYHDQGLAPLKALYFEESINVSLNLPIIRTSVDHGTAFDIAYKDKNPNLQSYINAIAFALKA